MAVIWDAGIALQAGLGTLLCAAILLSLDSIHPGNGPVSHVIEGPGISATSTASSSQPQVASSGALMTVVGVFVVTDVKVKHSFGEYEAWLAAYLESVSSPLVLYLANYDAEKVRRMRGSRPLIIREVASAWELPHAADMWSEYVGPQWSMDPERTIHQPELYAIWNAKAALLAEVAEANPFLTRYFSYLDVGMFRNGALPGWPDDERVHELFARQHNAMAFGIVEPIKALESIAASYAAAKPQYKDAGWRRFVTLIGGFFAGEASAVQRFAREFYEILQSAAAAGAFVGKDQDIMNYIAARDYGDKQSIFVGGGGCGDVWFFITHYLRATNRTTCDATSFGSG